MMVTFISQCEKKALSRTRRVLDTFADRIGDNTWQTVITQEGLLAVKKLLRKTASKNTAVSCHWIRSRSRTELVWVVGNKSKFNRQGIVPVNSTSRNNNYRDDQADWHYLPLIQSLASLAALLHDWGKASARFQEKLGKDYKGKSSDALRHEWVSCLLLNALVSNTNSGSDSGWLNLLADGEINESQLKQADLRKIQCPLTGLPPIAKLIAWLIVTHHRLPLVRPELLDSYNGESADTIDELFAYLTENWGYKNEKAGDTLQDCLRFPQGLIANSNPWLKELKRWAKKLRDQQHLVEKIMEEGSYRPILHHARLCLMLGDHYYSSLTLKESGAWQNTIDLVANTEKDGSPKQALDQHLVGVYQQTKRNVRKLPQLEQELPDSDNIIALRKKSPGKYSWQDKAAFKVHEWILQCNDQKQGFFAINMASTGCGKTFANAKVMLALSKNNDSLRYILALGLRTLTLQTGDEYRERIFQNSDGSDLAVLIGSKAIAELHNQEREQRREDKPEERGSESQETLLETDDEVLFSGDIPEDGLATILQKTKDRKFLYAPILACTIDHIMAATETTRGGRYILPSLRLMSSDLVIDEIDDFTDSDAIAIGRLIHLAGMLGRKVMISSATIPPALAEGYFNCYRDGWRLFSQTRNASPTVGCAWMDEYNTVVTNNNTVVTNNNASDAQQSNQQYAESHNAFIKKRVGKLTRELPKRKADIIDCQSVMAQHAVANADKTKQATYFTVIADAAMAKHQQHYQIDRQTGLKVSFGVIRTANISPCIALTRFLLDYECPADTTIRVMSYHSQQVLLLRHEQEKHLDAVLKRKEERGEDPAAFNNEVIRRHLDELATRENAPSNMLFILVATPVEEVGRDHDFDWAVVEPSSYRSIIQLAGRVRRHRGGEASTSNIGLLQYNWKTVREGDKEYACYFSRPGYEFNGKILVNGIERNASCFTHDLKQLVSETSISKRLDAIPRIDENPPEGFGLAKLEHAVTAHWLKRYDAKGPETLQGYLGQHWYLTALPQALNRFRQGRASIHLYRCFDNSGHAYFTVKNERGLPEYTILGDLVNQDDDYRITSLELTTEQKQRLWLCRDYRILLEVQAEENEISLDKAALRYGELVIQEPYKLQSPPNYLYNDQLGLFKDERR